MAETMLRHRLQSRSIDAHVHSAGLMEGGFPATADTLAALSDRGLDASAHRSRQLTATLVGEADLVLGMTRRHVMEAVVMDPPAWGHAFTLKEAVRRTQQVGPRRAGEDISTYVRRLHTGRNRADLLGESPVDDILDPVTQPGDVSYAEARDEIEKNVDALVEMIWGSA